jgi:DNA-binding response OmpR family regulator
MRILVVDDDRSLGEFLKKCMEREGHDVQWVGDGEGALSSAASFLPDLIILDLSLPRLDGMEVLAKLRGCAWDGSVLVLTGRNLLNDRVRCLDLGADDCLLKPFSFLELMARARAVLRRREQSTSPVLRHGDLEMYRLERRVVRAGRNIDLTAKEFALLEYLMGRRGQCVSRVELLEQVWQMPASAGTNVVDVYVNYLRRKLGAAGQRDLLDVIETVRGSGYRMRTVQAAVPLRMAALPQMAFA